MTTPRRLKPLPADRVRRAKARAPGVPGAVVNIRPPAASEPPPIDRDEAKRRLDAEAAAMKTAAEKRTLGKRLGELARLIVGFFT